MSVRVSMEFDGLCGFVPDKKAGSGDVVEQWVAVLPDLRRTFAPRHGITTAIAPHVACVIVPDEGVIDMRSNKLPSAIFRSPRFEDRVYRLYEFDGERLNLRYGRDHEHVRASVTGFATSEPKPSEETDLGWVAPMAEMGLTDAGAFDKRLFDETRMPTAPAPTAAPAASGEEVSAERPPPVASLVGTVVLDRGTLATDGVVEREIQVPSGGKSRASETVIFEFKPPVARKPVREQAQANHVVWSDELPDKSLELRFTGADEHARTVVLRPVDGEVAIKVFNLELETILKIGEGHDLRDEHGDPDFAIFYAISTGWPFDVEQVPVPHPMKPDQVVVGGRRQTCKPGLFLGWR